MVHSQSSPYLTSASKPQGHHGWLAPALVGTAAALGAAALYTAKRRETPSASTRLLAAFSTWTGFACTTSSGGPVSPWRSSTATAP